MHTLALSLVLAGLPAGQTSTNFDFSARSLEGWEGTGFYLTSANPRGPSLNCGVCSSDAESPTGKGMLRYVFTVPANAEKISCSAFAAFPFGKEADDRLDVVLADEKGEPLPKQVQTGAGWVSAPHLLSRWSGAPRHYAWNVSGLGGRRLQIVLVDQDSRPGYYVYAADFKLVVAPTTPHAMTLADDDSFFREMILLQQKYNFSAMAKYDSKRFQAVSNAGEKFTGDRVRNCEIFYDLFLDHFERKGFTVKAPAARLMLAIFDSPAGFDAYLGRKMPPGITGIYHPASNRLVLYNQNENVALIAMREQALKKGKFISQSPQRTSYEVTVSRQFSELSKDVNISTTMHECAHQVSFNCGLLNREGNVPAWLAEGLACYCEASDMAGEWRSIGSPNPMRMNDLARAHDQFIPLQDLAKSDSWLGSQKVLVGYAQSWALFRLLMENHPSQLRSYMKLIYERRTPEYRLTDFRQCFGPNLAPLETEYHNYLRDLAGKKAP